MKSLTFPNQNTLILLNKGGSSLIGWMIKLYCDWKGIPIKHNHIGNQKVVLVVRNPLDRYISGFLHRHLITNLQLWEGNEGMIPHLEKWVDQNPQIESGEEVDYHIWRASSILRREGIQPHTILKIEEWGRETEKWAAIRKGAREPIWDTPQPPSIPTPPPLLSEIGIECEGWDGVMWAGLYRLSAQNMEGHHRRDKTDGLIRELRKHPILLNRIKDWVSEDYTLWGYQKMI